MPPPSARPQSSFLSVDKALGRSRTCPEQGIPVPDQLFFAAVCPSLYFDCDYTNVCTATVSVGLIRMIRPATSGTYVPCSFVPFFLLSYHLLLSCFEVPLRSQNPRNREVIPVSVQVSGGKNKQWQKCALLQCSVSSSGVPNVPVALARAYGTGGLGVRNIISVINEGRKGI